MSLMMIIFWTLVIGGVIWLVRNGGRRQQPPAPSDSTAQHILDERFARGDRPLGAEHAGELGLGLLATLAAHEGWSSAARQHESAAEAALLARARELA